MTIKRTVAQLLLWGAPLVAGQTLAPAVFAQGQPQLTEQQKAEERAKKRGPQTPPPQKQPKKEDFIDSILKNGLDQLEPVLAERAAPVGHENVRGKGYYQ